MLILYFMNFFNFNKDKILNSIWLLIENKNIILKLIFIDKINFFLFLILISKKIKYIIIELCIDVVIKINIIYIIEFFNEFLFL